ncbi:MAG: hypothetical protein IJY71_02980 [Clostridia bacterium]|nr:hypothetical protein [Clostridia bacterium]
MEKETFYEKLQKLEPTVKAYLDAKKIADMPESIYVREKCGASIPCLDSNSRVAEEEKSLVSTLKIIRIIMAVAAIWGIVCVIIGIANSSGMDIALGVGICVPAQYGITRQRVFPRILRLDNIQHFVLIPYSPYGLRTYRLLRISSTATP